MFIPLYDGHPMRFIRAPAVSWGIIALTVLVHMLAGSGWLVSEPQYRGLTYALGVVPASLTGHAVLPPELAVIPPVATTLTYALLHVDWWHLASNMLFLYVFGDNVEDAMGHARFALFYGLCALAGGLCFALLGPHASSIPLIGASGAVSGVVVAYMMLHPNVRVWVLAIGKIPLRIPALWCVGAWIIFQFAHAFFIHAQDGVGWLAHIGGIIAGICLIAILKRPNVALLERHMGISAK